MHLLRDASQEKRALAFNQRALEFIERRTSLSLNLCELPSPDPNLLSPREMEILRLFARGGYDKTIAGYLGISPFTVRNHIQNISGKLGLHTRLELLIYAFQNHLI